MLIVATLPSTLILYLWAVLVWQWYNRVCLSETCLKRQRRSKAPPNARCVPPYDFSEQKVNVQRKFTNKLLFMVTLWIGKMWWRKNHLAGKKFDDDDEVQEQVMTWFKGKATDFYNSGIQSWFQDLRNLWIMPATMLKNKVMYRQFIHSVAFVN